MKIHQRSGWAFQPTRQGKHGPPDMPSLSSSSFSLTRLRLAGVKFRGTPRLLCHMTRRRTPRPEQCIDLVVEHPSPGAHSGTFRADAHVSFKIFVSQPLRFIRADPVNGAARLEVSGRLPFLVMACCNLVSIFAVRIVHDGVGSETADSEHQTPQRPPASRRLPAIRVTVAGSQCNPSCQPRPVFKRPTRARSVISSRAG